MPAYNVFDYCARNAKLTAAILPRAGVTNAANAVAYQDDKLKAAPIDHWCLPCGAYGRKVMMIEMMFDW